MKGIVPHLGVTAEARQGLGACRDIREIECRGRRTVEGDDPQRRESQRTIQEGYHPSLRVSL
mgnify:CR=1 FL=1